MMALTEGSNSFRRATQSTPDMLGNWMSIKTNSGSALGRTFKASSAVEQVQIQRKSSERLMMVFNPSRVVLLSSTMATLVMALFQGQPEFDSGSFSLPAGDFTGPSHF